jgi:hypothetical protein
MKRFKAVYLVLVGLLVGGAMSSALASDNFGELNVKAGLNLTTVMKAKYGGEASTAKLKPCPSLNVEYLLTLGCFSQSLDFLKCGLGLGYLVPTKIDKAASNTKISYFPIYFTLQFNPLTRANDEYLKGIFVKGNIGYNAYFSSDLKNAKDTGGLYYAIGAGYEFPFGALIELMYSEYDSSSKFDDGSKTNFTYSCVGLNVGYKFKI